MPRSTTRKFYACLAAVWRGLSTFCEGASVAVVDVDEAGVHAVVREITANGGKAIVADLREARRGRG